MEFMKQMHMYNPPNFWHTILEGHNKAKLPNLPSWCPDFNAPKIGTQINRPNHRAGIPITPATPSSAELQGGMVISSLNQEASTLSVPGLTVDTVHQCTATTLNYRLYQKRVPSSHERRL